MSAAQKLQDKQTNAVIYARYSCHGQQEQSIEGQIRDCNTYAEREGLKVVGEYIDRALSGKTDDRPDFRRMISDSSKKQFQYIIVWKLDRFSRNRIDSAMNKHELKKNGVKVVSAMENISDNPEGKLLEGIIESVAEYYSGNLAQNVKRGMRETILKGSHTGGTTPFGFKSIVDGDKRKLVADEHKAPIIRYVFEEYAKGTSKKKIMQELTARGVLNYDGNPLTLSCLQNTLKNPKYIGKYMYDGEEVPGACEALISEEIFDAVQAKLENAKQAPAAKKARQDYLLQGKAFCGHCGARLIGESGANRHGKIYNYYTCAKRKKYHTCEKKNEKKDYLEWYVVEQTVEYVLSEPRIEYIADCVIEAYDKEFNDTQINESERNIKKIDKEVANLINAIAVSPGKAAAKLAEKIEVLETQKADIELNLVTLRIANGNRFTREQLIKWLKSFCAGDKADVKYQRRIIDLFVNSVYVYDDKIVIYYNVKSGKQISYIEMSDDMEGLEPVGGDATENRGESVRVSNSPGRQYILNPNPRFIFVNGVFGIVVKR